MNRWVLPIAFSLAVHLNVLFMMPEASFPTPGRPAILKARLVTLPSAAVRPPATANPPAEVPPAARSLALTRTAKDSSRTEKASKEASAPPGKPGVAAAPGKAAKTELEEPSGNPPAAGEMPAAEESPVPREARGPDILSRKSPLYPLASRRKGESGTVLVLVRLDGQGQVREASVRSSSGYPALDLSAMAAVGKWKFRPGAPSLLLVPVVFRLE